MNKSSCNQRWPALEVYLLIHRTLGGLADQSPLSPLHVTWPSHALTVTSGLGPARPTIVVANAGRPGTDPSLELTNNQFERAILTFEV